MGYFINSNPLSNYKKIIIPESFLQNAITGSQYFFTEDLGANKFWFVTFCAFRLINSTVDYDGFSHIELYQTSAISQGIIETAISQPTAGVIMSDRFYTFAYNQQHTPNKLGAYTSGPRYGMEFEGGYVSGNGDIEVHFYYNEITI